MEPSSVTVLIQQASEALFKAQTAANERRDDDARKLLELAEKHTAKARDILRTQKQTRYDLVLSDVRKALDGTARS